MLGHSTPSVDTKTMHGSISPEVMRPNLAGKQRAGHLNQFQSPQDSSHQHPYSPITNASPVTYTGTPSSNGVDQFSHRPYKRSNSDRQDSGSVTPGSRSQRHASFGVIDGVKPDFARPALQTGVGPYGGLSSASPTHYQGSQQSPQHSYIPQQHFTPFSLPPPTFPATSTSISSARDSDSNYPTSMSNEYQSESVHHSQSGPDMMLLDQMTAPNTMPVFGGEGYNRSPFAIPEDFVAYLFSGQQLDNSSPMGQMNQPAYAS